LFEKGGLDISEIRVYTHNYEKGNTPTRYSGTQGTRRSLHLHAYSQSGACDYSVLRDVFAAEWLAHDPVYRAGGDHPFRAWATILSLLTSGTVKPIVERTYKLEDSAEALRHLIEDRPFGRVVLAG
jgi:NADPH:quinone reductase-like Zn-dependent oxidoreductase